MRLLSQAIDFAADHIRSVRLPALITRFSGPCVEALGGSCEGPGKSVDSVIAGSVKLSAGSSLIGCYVGKRVRLELASGAVCLGCSFSACSDRRLECVIRVGEGTVMIGCSSDAVNLFLGRGSLYDNVMFKNCVLAPWEQDDSLEQHVKEIRIGPFSIFLSSRIELCSRDMQRSVSLSIGRGARVAAGLDFQLSRRRDKLKNAHCLHVGDGLMAFSASTADDLYRKIDQGGLPDVIQAHSRCSAPTLRHADMFRYDNELVSGIIRLTFNQHFPAVFRIGDRFRVGCGLTVRTRLGVVMGNDVRVTAGVSGLTQSVESSILIECGSLSLGSRDLVTFDRGQSYWSVSDVTELHAGRDATLVLSETGGYRNVSVLDVPAGVTTVI